MQNSPIIPQSNDAGKDGRAFAAAASAPQAVAPDELEEAGAMAVDEAAKDEGEDPEEAIAKEEEGGKYGQASAAAVPEEARVPKTKKSPVGMTAAEWLSLIHI